LINESQQEKREKRHPYHLLNMMFHSDLTSGICKHPDVALQLQLKAKNLALNHTEKNRHDQEAPGA